MTEEELQAMRDRATKATPGPWEYRFRSNGPAVETQDGNKHIAFYALQMDADNVDVNGDFIAHAREDIPALLAEVERLRAVEYSHRMADSPQAQAAIQREHDRFMAEHTAMREIVQAVVRLDYVKYFDDAGAAYYECPWCGSSYEDEDDLAGLLEGSLLFGHTPDCPVTKARAILER